MLTYILLRDKSQAARKNVFRLALTASVFLAVWGLLAGLGAAVVDTQAVLKWLNEREWLQFIAPDIRNTLISQGWQPLAAMVLAFLSYRALGAPASYLAKQYLERSYGLTADAKRILKVLNHKKTVKRSMSGLIEETRLSRDRVEAGLKQLISKGLARERPAEEGPGIRYSVTQEGTEYLDKMSEGETQKH